MSVECQHFQKTLSRQRLDRHVTGTAVALLTLSLVAVHMAGSSGLWCLRNALILNSLFTFRLQW